VERLSRWFEHFLFPPAEPHPEGGGPICTVIGSGGKTSLIWRLAESQRRRKVLVSPTAKMYPPPPEQRRYDRYFSGGEGASFSPDGRESPGGTPPAGITLAGILNEETGKLEALPPALLEQIVSGYELALLEGDGSQGLPLKGWADHEPVVPSCATLTVGVIPITPLGKKVSGDTVFRLPQFIRLSGAKEGEALTPAHLAAVITGNAGERGLFSAAQGRKLLFINQADGPARRKQAREVMARLPKAFLAGLAGIIAGSVTEDRIEVLFPPPSSLR
jgi:probable selenium-dependent hydroxylase accessory protein YqeC